jgi:PAS domain S-box-containing protein
MSRRPVAGDEPKRSQSLRALGLLDTAPHEHYDRLTALVQRIFDVPIAMVTFVDEDRLWFRSHAGLSGPQTTSEVAFCSHTIAARDVLVIPDAREDPRFRANPVVTGPPFVVFYAGCPLPGPDGRPVGTLSMIDHRPRTLSPEQLELLRDLASVVDSEASAFQVAAFDQLPIGVYRSTPDGRLLDANPALVALLGHPDRASLLATSAWDLHPDPGARARLLAQADRQSGLRGVETQVRRLDGTLVWVRLNTFLARDKQGGALFYFGTIEDITERRLAEDALWDSEARLKLLLDQLPAVLWTTDKDLRFTMSQGAGLAALNLVPSAITGRTLFDYFGTTDPEFPPIAAHRRALSTEPTAYSIEWQGHVYDCLARPLFETDGSVAGTLGFALDVTDRTRGARQMRAVLESALDAVIGMDSEGRITAWNARAQETFGWSLPEVLGREVADVIMPERYREAHRRGLRHFLASGEGPILGRRVELFALRRGGAEFPVELSVSVLREADGVSFSAFVSDISERKRSEEELRQGEERYRALYERERAGREQAERLRAATSALGSTLDLHEVLALILRELQRVVPYDSASVQELRGDFMEVIAGHGFPTLEGILGTRFDVRSDDNPNCEVFRTRAPVVLDDAPAAFHGFAAGVHAMTPARSWIGVPLLFGDRLIGMLALDKNEPGFYTREEHVGLAESFAAPAAIAMEHARLYAAAREELAERKRLEEQFRQSQKMEAVGRLAGGIAHDFNNLLGVILGYTELAGRRLDASSPARPRLEQIRKAAERAAALTGQLLAFSRKQVLMPEVLDLSGLIVDLTDMLRRLIGEDIELATVLPEGLGLVRADPGQLGQAILNLAVNARDAMPRGGRLVIEAANVEVPRDVKEEEGLAAGPYVRLAVRDSGAGMSPDVLSQIFEPFFTTKELGKGTGLGLSMVYGFLEQSGGHVSVRSEVGKGTVFDLYLPRLPEDARVAQPLGVVVAAPLEGSETILVAEDADSLRAMIAEVLGSNGYVVMQAATAEQALRVAREHPGPIHMLLTDVVMPGMSGVDLAEKLRLVRPAAGVLFMSGYTDDMTIQRGVLAEDTALIRKPFAAAALLLKIRETLGTTR